LCSTEKEVSELLKQFFEDFEQDAPELFQMEADEANISQCSTSTVNCTVDVDRVSDITIVNETQTYEKTVCVDAVIDRPTNSGQGSAGISDSCEDQQFQYPGHIPPLRLVSYAFLMYTDVLQFSKWQLSLIN
jgi:hypothetical protein